MHFHTAVNMSPHLYIIYVGQFQLSLYSLFTFLHKISLINFPLIINYYILNTIHTEAACVSSARQGAIAHVCNGSSMQTHTHAQACTVAHTHTHTHAGAHVCITHRRLLRRTQRLSFGRRLLPLRCGSVLASSCVKPFRSNLFVCCLLYMHILCLHNLVKHFMRFALVLK